MYEEARQATRILTLGCSRGVILGCRHGKKRLPCVYCMLMQLLVSLYVLTICECYGAAVVRRQHLAAGVRQEHARGGDSDGPPEQAVPHGLRRHHQTRRQHHNRPTHRCSFSLPELWCAPGLTNLPHCCGTPIPRHHVVCILPQCMTRAECIPHDIAE